MQQGVLPPEFESGSGVYRQREPLVHDENGLVTRLIEWVSLITAAALLSYQIARLGLAPQVWHWWVLPVAIAGMLTADLISGLVHWTADTWFEETMPVLGRRFLRPFRVHHVNPADFLRRDFVDTNGDVSMLTIPILAASFWLPLDVASGQAAVVFLVALCAAVIPTNQVHQWAHMSDPPPVICWLQRYNLILSRAEHSRHHVAPFTTNYCIALGWCNPALSAIRFFPRLEWMVSRLTGIKPRADDTHFQAAA